MNMYLADYYTALRPQLHNRKFEMNVLPEIGPLFYSFPGFVAWECKCLYTKRRLATKRKNPFAG